MMAHAAPFTDTGTLVFVSGQLAFDADMQIVSPTIEGQVRQVLKNIETVLEGALLGIEDIVKANVWLAHGVNFAAFDSHYAAYLGRHMPARSTVYSSLAVPGALVEIEVIACRQVHRATLS